MIQRHAVAAAVALSLLFQAIPAFASDIVTNPGVIGKVVSLDESGLGANGISTVALGEVVLTSGRIVAADLLIQPNRPPFLVTVPPGRYPVTLYQAEGRIAAAVMRFAEGDPDRWQLAVIEGEDVATLKAGEYFGYGVDTGLGSYMDRDTAALINERNGMEQAERGESYISYYDDVVADELAKNGDHYALHQPIATKPGNAAIFSSGWGDGFYPVYWGLDKHGMPVVLLTDFQVIVKLVDAPGQNK